MYLGLGSNVGDRRAHLAHALRRLREEFALTGASAVWETDPVGYEDQGRFLNLVARVEVDEGATTPRDVLETARAIEQERGRERREKNGPRTLDIDVLLFEDVVVDEEGLEVPHPRMHDRAFVLAPLLELDPGLEHPVTGARFAELDAADPAAREGMERVMSAEEMLYEDDHA